MIKVNLMRSISVQQVGGTGVFQTSAGASMVLAPGRKIFAKTLTIVGPVALLVAYGHMSKQERAAELAQISAKIAQIESERAALGQSGKDVERWSGEKKKADQRLDVLRGLTSTRLREVKALDAIQSLMPTSTWLNKLEFKDGKVSMTGFSMTEDGVTDLIKSLEASVFFSEVEVVAAVQEQSSAGTFKRFELNFMVGR